MNSIKIYFLPILFEQFMKRTFNVFHFHKKKHSSTKLQTSPPSKTIDSQKCIKFHQLNFPTGGARIILTRHTSNLPEMHPSLALLWMGKPREGKYDRLKYLPYVSGPHMHVVQPIIGANWRCSSMVCLFFVLLFHDVE